MTRGVSDTTQTSATAASALGGPQAMSGLEGTAGVGSSSGTDFASLLSGGLDKLQGLQSTSDDLALKAATGNLTNVHDYMIASNEAQLATQLTAAVRNKAVEAFTEIMRMQI
ncbi:flagellar hook-basal body complex protein FliE [Kineococcus sp. R8]|nr:flagellar hook-basal body complex protein FliE [Kineococcus siccus]